MLAKFGLISFKTTITNVTFKSDTQCFVLACISQNGHAY